MDCELSGIAVIPSFGTRILYQSGSLNFGSLKELKNLINLFDYQALQEPCKTSPIDIYNTPNWLDPLGLIDLKSHFTIYPD